MILLDTNVVSAIMRLPDEPRVRDWLDTQDRTQLHICTPTIFELSHGIERLPFGRRRLSLERALAEVILHDLGDRILDLEVPAAIRAGKLRAFHMAQGFNIDPMDHLIAGIALVHGAAVATRNTRDFIGLGLSVIDPWG